jgi:hypothetical protein
VPVSGSRLRLQAWDFDGARLISPELFDLELQQPCKPDVWADNVTRCTPDAPRDLSTASRLVTVEVSSPVGDDRLQHRDYTSADGMRMLWAVHDRTLDTTCAFRRDGTCTPNAPMTNLAYYSDAACAKPLFDDRGMGAPAVVRSNDQYYAVGAPVLVNELYVGSPSSCSPYAPIPGHTYHALTVVTLATADRVVGAQSRIGTIEYVAGDLRVPEGDLHDRQLDALCTPMVFGDDIIRCSPAMGSAFNGYSDASCTMPTTVLVGPCGFTHGLVRDVTNLAVDVVGAEGPDPIGLYEKINGTCVWRQASYPENGWCAASAGASILDQLAVGELIVL